MSFTALIWSWPLPPKIRRVVENGVDNQLAALVIPIDFQPDDVAGQQHVASADFAASTGGVLINHRPLLSHAPGRALHHQIAFAGYLQTAGAAEAHLDRARVGARRQHEVIFQLIVAAVVNHVDAWICLAILHPRIVGHVRVPVSPRANHVIGARLHRVQALNRRLAITVYQRNIDGLRPAEAQRRTLPREEQVVPAAPRRILHRGSPLSPIRFKT